MNNSTRLTAAATVGAMLAMCGDVMLPDVFRGSARGPSGRGMKWVGKDEEGQQLLEDSYGKRYVQTKRGIRRVK
jgi:hypothetical protein